MVTRRNRAAKSAGAGHDPERNARELLDMAGQLMRELHPRKAPGMQVSLDSSLEADLGLDSLARVELISRLEQHFQVALPPQVFADAESPRDLLGAIVAAQGREAAVESLRRIELREERVDTLPYQARTLVEVLQWHCSENPDRLHLRVTDGEQELATLSYAGLWQGAGKVAAGLQQRGVQPGECIAIMLPTGLEYFFSFFGILMTGAIPVPVYPPVRRSQIGEHLQRYGGIFRNCEAALLITIPEAKGMARLLRSRLEKLQDIVTVDDLQSRGGNYQAPAIGPDDIAFVQYTSGSTGSPKGVVLTHANLLANIRAMGRAVRADSRDVFVSWLPLYHDMGLIGAWLGSLYFAVALVVMSPLAFITRPRRWLQTIHRYRATLSASPNFGYELCLKQVADKDIEALDLTSWRIAFNGAEQISPDTMERFSRRFAVAGFKAEAMTPVYGLAESSVGLAFPPLNRAPRIDSIEREVFSREGRANPVDDHENALRFVSSGSPLPGHEIRIVDEQDRELPERHEGNLQFRGPSATAGYFRRSGETEALFHGDWLDSGDLAYMAGGEVFITGRRKDVIIRGGRNLYPNELEEAVGRIPGVRSGCVAALGVREARTGTERLVILAETRERDAAAREALRKQAATTVTELAGMPPDEVRLVAPHAVLKTSSGKIRRSACREAYEKGELDRPPPAMWQQVARMARQSLVPTWHRWRRWMTSHSFAAYAWTMYGLLAGPALVSVLVVPGFDRRWKILRSLARALAFVTGTRLLVIGRERLPPADQPCVFVANHASYLDGYALVAAIPRSFSFVAKAELAAQALPNHLLRRMRVQYVKRFERDEALEDAQRISATAQRGQSVFFFPEGTFTRIPGVRDFHLGAFVTAAQASIPVVPIAIRGTRSMLRSDSWFPRPGGITITIGAAIEPGVSPGTGRSDIWQGALSLRSQARAHVVRHCGEPDLAQG